MQNEDYHGCGFLNGVIPKFVSTVIEWFDAEGLGTRIWSMNGHWLKQLKCKIEVAEYKSKMEVEATKFAMKLERQKNKFRAREMKYQFALACSVGLFVVLSFYPVSNIFSSRLMLPWPLNYKMCNDNVSLIL